MNTKAMGVTLIAYLAIISIAFGATSHPPSLQQDIDQDSGNDLTPSGRKFSFALPNFQFASSQQENEGCEQMQTYLYKMKEELKLKEERLIEMQKRLDKLSVNAGQQAVCHKEDKQRSINLNTIINLLKQISSKNSTNNIDKLEMELEQFGLILKSEDLKLGEIVESLKEANNILKENNELTKEKYTEKPIHLVYAVNCGGSAHIDVHGIYYIAEPVDVGNIDTSSSVPSSSIGRVPQQDFRLYNTYRASDNTFGYDIPIKEDGNYVIVVKFVEGAYKKPNMRVFNVQLNKAHTAIENLDIFALATNSVGLDLYIEFTVAKGRLMFKGETSVVNDQKVALELVRSKLKNVPDLGMGIQAFCVFKGELKDIPKMPPTYYAKN